MVKIQILQNFETKNFGQKNNFGQQKKQFWAKKKQFWAKKKQFWAKI